MFVTGPFHLEKHRFGKL